MSSPTYASSSPTKANKPGVYTENDFPALRLARTSRLVRRVGRVMLFVLALTSLAMVFVPWQQSIRGEGAVIAFDPFERPQPVEAPVEGRIAWRAPGLREGVEVEEGDLLFRIVDQDPLYLQKLEQQLNFLRTEIQIARTRLETGQALKDNNDSIVKRTLDELSAMQAAGEQLIEAYDRFVDQAQNKVAAQKSKLAASEAKQFQAEQDFQRKNALFEEGIESQLKQQEAEQKFREAEANVKIAEQELENAKNGLEGKKNERESKRQEWEAKINKIKGQLEKARAEVAKAEISINKNTEEINQKEVKLLDQERKVDAQRSQEVTAPLSGYIMSLTAFASSTLVKPGDELCRIVPKTENPAVQLWVAGNDVTFISEGKHVRLQFEGWPAVQFSGWPSVAVGTFGGTVALVDATDDGTGRFRLVVLPDEDEQSIGNPKWPEYPNLRQGVRANGWVLLDQVPLGYEVWRRMNGFPPALKSGDETKTAKPIKLKI